MLAGLAAAALEDPAGAAALRHLRCRLGMRAFWVLAPLHPGPAGGFYRRPGNVFVTAEGDVLLPALNVLAVPAERAAGFAARLSPEDEVGDHPALRCGGPGPDSGPAEAGQPGPAAG